MTSRRELDREVASLQDRIAALESELEAVRAERDATIADEHSAVQRANRLAQRLDARDAEVGRLREALGIARQYLRDGQPRNAATCLRAELAADGGSDG